MENQNIEKTRCCHRLYEMLRHSSEQPLVGEPWFRFVSGGLYFSSRTKSEMVANLLIGRQNLNGGPISLIDKFEEAGFRPLAVHLLGTHRSLFVKGLSPKQLELVLCRELGDFFRLHYQKLG